MMKNKLYGTPKVGADILSYCTRCKIELAHVIVSMVDSTPAKVLCKTCKSQHNHRKSGSPSVARKTRSSSSKSRPKSATAVSRLWEQKVAESKGATLSYDLRQSFNSGDLINHSIFGVGVVEEKRSGKITVLFRQGEKVLIHERS